MGRVGRLGDAASARACVGDGQTGACCRLTERSQSASHPNPRRLLTPRTLVRNLCGLRRRSRSYRFPSLPGHPTSTHLYHRPIPVMSPLRPVRVPSSRTSSLPLPTPRWPCLCTKVPSWILHSTTLLCSNLSRSTCLVTSSVRHFLFRLLYSTLTSVCRAHRRHSS